MSTNATQTQSRELSPIKRELLEKRLRGAFKATAREQLIPRRPPNATAPLSFAQESLWFIDQLEPGSDAYNVPVVLRLHGRIQPAILETALNEILRRHEILRATFPVKDGKPTQHILPFEPRSLPIENLREQSSAQRDPRIQELTRKETHQPFDLAHGPLVRWRLLSLAHEEHLLIITMHHIVSDGWSMAVFFRELQMLYEATLNDRPAPFSDLPIQYGDFSSWQRETMRGPVLEKHLGYWKDKLASAPASLVFPGNPVAQQPTALADQFRPAAQQSLLLSKDCSESLSTFAQQQGASPFMTMLAALFTVLSRWTGQSDLVIGTVVAGRTRREIENLIGCFMNFLPLRAKIAGDPTALEILTQVKATVLEAYAHQDCPFEKIVEAIKPARKGNQNPLYNVAFLMQNFPRGDLHSREFAAKFLPTDPQAALLDLRFLAEETEDGFLLTCEYDTKLFAAETIKQLVEGFRRAVESLVQQPARRISELQLDHGLATRATISPLSPRKRQGQHEDRPLQKIAIAATFTAEPVAESLNFWIEKLDLPVTVEFAPYNQVFQQLLDPTSLLAANQSGLNLVLLRLEDWERFATANVTAQSLDLEQRIEESVRELAQSLRTAAARSRTPWLVCVCPASNRAASNVTRSALFARMEQKLAAELSNLSGVYLISPADISALYPVAEYDDPHGDELGHVPYTPLFFAALGTLIARKFHALKRAPKKVIVLDCDQTLWSGVCGEDGPRGVKLDAPRRALQTFMRAQLDAGMLLCICSKNSEEDVRAVFDCCPDMLLRLDDFTASRINWQPKSENLRSLAEELKLGLDSFILVDDNPVECAEVEANCPEALTVQLPGDPELIPQFLRHTWVFDHLKLTSEDRNRAALYQQNRQREQLQTQSLSLAEFIAGLNLQVRIEEPRNEQLARVAQLTERTNQFNFTTRRRTEAEVQHIEPLKILAVSVADRFGDYGLVGVIIYELSGETLKVDTFLLSCRVLGKGIEHRMLGRLGEIAQTHGCRWVAVQFISSPRNKPALDFLESVGADFRQSTNGHLDFHFPAAHAANIAFNPERAAPRPQNPQPTLPGSPDPLSDGKFQISSAQVRWIALNAHNPALVLQTLASTPVPQAAPSQDYVPPRNPLEEQLCRAWEELLRLERVSVRDDFFERGGSSLMAVQLLARARKISGKNIPLSALFQAPTVEQLARLIADKPASSSAMVALQSTGRQPPLVLVHGAGGGILWGYANLATHLGSDQPVYAIEPQAAMGERSSVEELASRYLTELRTLQPNGPYKLGGYCFGGYVAYEMARQLRTQGENVALVMLIDSAAPNGSYEKVTWWRPSFLPNFICNFFYWLQDFFNLTPTAQHDFVRRQFRVLKKKIIARFRRAGTKRIHLEKYVNTSDMPEHELSFWRLHLRAGADYVPQKCPGRVTLLRTRSQPLFCSFDPTYGWGDLATEGVDIKIIPGSHENIFVEPDVRSLAQQVKACLATAQGGGTEV